MWWVVLTHGAFHFKVDEALEFNAVFNGELANEVVDKAVDAEAHGLCFAKATLLHVEDLFGTDFADAGFVLDAVALAFDDNGWVGVGTGVGVDEECVAFGVVFAAPQVGGDVDKAAVGSTAVADGDGLGDDVAGGFVRCVDHFGSGVLVLTVVGECDGDDFATGFGAFEDDARVFHGEAGADVAVDPFVLGFCKGKAAFGDEVVDVGTPVLDGDVLDFCTRQRDKFDDCTVQCRGLEAGGGAAFHVGNFGAFVSNDEGAFKLSKVFGVDAEVGLEGLADFDARGYVDEGSSGEDGTVECSEFVVTWGDDFAEPFFEDVGVVIETFGGADKDDALFGKFFFHVGVGGFGVKLGFYSCKEFALFFGDAEAFEGFFDVFGDFFPAAPRVFVFGEVVADVVVVDVVEVSAGPVGGVGFVEKDVEGFFTEFANPRSVVFDVTNVVDGAFAESVASVVGVVFGVVEVAKFEVEVEFVFLLGCWVHGCRG